MRNPVPMRWRCRLSPARRPRRASIRIDAGIVLKPGETYTTPRTFLAVFTGDYYEPLSIGQKSSNTRVGSWPSRRARPLTQTGAAGEPGGFTREQILGTIPKIKEFGIKSATLDSGWFNDTGDWDPDPKNFRVIRCGAWSTNFTRTAPRSRFGGKPCSWTLGAGPTIRAASLKFFENILIG